jgi:hypothetical protein
MQTFYFTLSLKYELCKQLYITGINSVVMKADNGKRIQLPVRNLRPHVSPMGINGRFRLMIDENNKIKSFEKIA